MLRLEISKNSKVPLYHQVKDMFIHRISTGDIRPSEEMPRLVDLTRELGISYETVRRAYRELKEEGFISISRGRRTTVSPIDSRKNALLPEIPMSNTQLAEAQRSLLLRFIRNQMDLKEITKLIGEQYRELKKREKDSFVVFCECNQYQTSRVSKLLGPELGIRVMPVVLKDLDRIYQSMKRSRRPLAIITTGFHLKAVRNVIADDSLDFYALILNMSERDRRILYSCHQNTRFGIICRDADAIPIYEALLRAELKEAHLNISSCTITNKNEVKNILKSSDLLVATPAVILRIKKDLPDKLPVIDMFDAVDPMSLKIIKDNIMEKRALLVSSS